MNRIYFNQESQGDKQQTPPPSPPPRVIIIETGGYEKKSRDPMVPPSPKKS